MKKEQTVEFLANKIKNEQLRVQMVEFIETTPIGTINMFLGELRTMQVQLVDNLVREREAVEDVFERQETDLMRKSEMASSQEERDLTNNELDGLRATHTINLRTKDSKIDVLFTKHLKEQQARLAKEGIPGFVVTDDPELIRTQMHLIETLLSLPA